MKSFDVIIIGAGPAGLQCARKLGGTKLSVLLIDKKEKIGSKVCAGGLTKDSIKFLNLPSDLIEKEFNKVSLHINKSLSVIGRDKPIVSTIDREKLGQWQLSKIKDFKNIQIKTNTRASKINKDYIVVNGEKIKYKFLIGAGGALSIVRKYLNLKTKNISVAFQYKIFNKKFKKLELFFKPKLFSSWYAWIFPHKNYTSIGCGCEPSIDSLQKIKSNFNKWLKNKGIDVSQKKLQAAPINFNYQGHRFGNIFLIGEAAGFTSRLTGEGIYQALVSGQEVAKMILNPAYKSKNICKLLRTKRLHNLGAKILIKSGPFKSLVLQAGRLAFKHPVLKEKLIRNLG